MIVLLCCCLASAYFNFVSFLVHKTAVSNVNDHAFILPIFSRTKNNFTQEWTLLAPVAHCPVDSYWSWGFYKIRSKRANVFICAYAEFVIRMWKKSSEAYILARAVRDSYILLVLYACICIIRLANVKSSSVIHSLMTATGAFAPVLIAIGIVVQ